MAIGKMQRYAKVASRREVEILDSLKEYYRGKWSLGRAAEAANIPTLRPHGLHAEAQTTLLFGQERLRGWPEEGIRDSFGSLSLSALFSL